MTGCRDRGGTGQASSDQAADVGGPSTLADDAAEAPAADEGPAEQPAFVPRAPVEAWATWPMPNAPLPGLPNPQSYDTRIAGVVIDRVTGLMWQRNVANKFLIFDDAQRECGRAHLAGYDDWRLPSRIELVSIMDLTRTQPSIDLAIFPGTPSDGFWTASVAADDPGAAWYVYFYFGYPKTDVVRNKFSVRCVRNTTPRPPLPARYDIQAGAVRDVATGLTWQRTGPAKTLRFDAAQTYCGQLTLVGKKGWRLPTLGELLTLVDERAAASPMIDSAAFPGTPAAPFWTGSTFANGREMAWTVYFNHGNAIYDLLAAKYLVRCVI